MNTYKNHPKYRKPAEAKKITGGDLETGMEENKTPNQVESVPEASNSIHPKWFKAPVVPKVIFWQTSFTAEDPSFRVAIEPDATLASLAHEVLGVNLIDKYKDCDYIELAVSGVDDTDKLVVATWEQFLKKASVGQILDVERYLIEKYQ